ncbi:MAG: hypothetical protein H0T75_03920, partial [Rhizobiales bacterium]|nr:hypothetical protein [Hyphomicrobiales bacterium]
MRRPLAALALVFMLVLAGAGLLLTRPGPDPVPLAANMPDEGLAESPGAAPGGPAPDGTETAAETAGTVTTGSPTDGVATSTAPNARAVGAPEGADEPDLPAQAGDVASVPPTGTAEPPNPGAAGEAPEVGEAPTFDVIRVEPTGEALIAGRARPGVEIEVLSDGEVIGRALADAEGAFVALPEAALAPGSHRLALREAGATEQAGPEREVTVAGLAEFGTPAPEDVVGGQDQLAANQPGGSGGPARTPPVVEDEFASAQPGNAQPGGVVQPGVVQPGVAQPGQHDSAQLGGAGPAQPGGATSDPSRLPAGEAPEVAGDPTFDVIRVEPTGEARIAGRARPGVEIEVLSDGEVIGRALADAEGAFVALPEAALAPG